jgi:hypothetical protein
VRRAFIIVSLVALLVTAATALAGGNGVVASANGDYGFSGQAAGSTFVIGPFTWNVKIKADGSVEGNFDYTQVRDGGVALSASGPLTCAFIEDEHVWVGGVITASSRASLVGLDMWFQARDNGEGANAAPDMSSTLGAAAAPAGQRYCDDHPPVMFPFLVGEGNLQVRSG